MANEEQAQNQFSRRGFLKGAAMVGAGIAGAAVLDACTPAAKSQKWDKTADVVVVGSGTASIAAVVAANAGLSAIVVEKASNFGGTTAISGGGMWIPNNYVMQAANVPDSKADALKYLQAINEGASTDELMNAYLDKAPEMLTWLRDKIGFKFQRSSPQSFADYYPWAPGVHDAVGGRMVSILRDDKVGAGKGLIQSIREYLDQHKDKVEILLETPARRLVTDATGAVLGVIAANNGAEIAIKANRGVLLGTGGFDYNKDMATAYLRGPLYFSVAVAGNTGDGHLMAQAIGADLRNMNSVWGLPGYVSKPGSFVGEADWQMYRGKPGSITVNKYGERFMNEASAYHPSIRSWYQWDSGRDEYRNIPAFALFDSGYTAHYPMPGAAYKVGVMPDWITQADTLDELAQKLGIDPAGLKQTVTTFNENAKNGVDPAWRRGEADFDQVTAGDKKRTDLKNPDLAPLETPPFYGAAITPGTCGTNGGLRTNANAQVINVWGQVIPDLFATGNTMAAFCGASYPGGGATVGQGMAFGYIAAQFMVASKSQG
jgi:succinate dehydrogenase/fumarate reductase flavoprotein subunit